MKITVYGRTFNTDFKKYILEFFDILHQNNVEILIYQPFYDFMISEGICHPKVNGFYKEYSDVPSDVDFMITIGGDGTFLEAIPFCRNFKIPQIGLNSGRLGFLAYISKDEIKKALTSIFQNKYEIENRSLIKIKTDIDIFGDLNFALNEFTVQKKDSTMITVDAFLDNEYLNTYWTDGLIVSTPTGSTAYSLSVGGPIVLPLSDNFIIAPIASHNLTVRPIVIPDNKVVTLKLHGRSQRYLITADNRTKEIEKAIAIELCKAEFGLKFVKLPDTSFYATIRNKLMWGADKRN